MVPAATAGPRAVAVVNVAKVGCVGLTIAGGVLEIAGFALVAYELARIQRREFGEPEFLKRLRLRLRRLLRRSVTVTAEAGGAIAIGGNARAEGVARRGPGDTLDERVEAIEENIGRLEAEMNRRQTRLVAEIKDVREKQTMMRSELDQERQAKEEERKAALRTSVTLQAWGTGLFVLGTVLSILGNTVNC